MFKAYDQLSQAELGYQVAWLCHRLGRISWLLAFHEAVEQLPKQSGSCQLAIHRKVLVEGLQHFQPREALIRQLWYGFRCSDTMQAALVDFIRFASPYWRPEVLELLESTNDLDVKIACLRYFGKYPCTDVLPLLRRFSQPDNPWELQAVTMYVLGAYPAANALGLLKAGLHSPFWHVRRNAAACWPLPP